MRELIKDLGSFGVVVILLIAITTSVIVALVPFREPEGIHFWTFAIHQHDAYLPPIAEWNRTHPDAPLAMTLLNSLALERRMLSGFLSGTPMADVLEAHEGIFPNAFLGPLDQVGFLDLTDRLYDEGLYEQFNEPSYSQQVSRRRHFGLPRGVQPALLAYRADIVEAAGINMSQIETWEDYFRILRPLMADNDGDGRPDRYLLNLSEIDTETISMLVLQNDGVIFDESDRPVFANPRVAQTLATLTTWITGPQRATTYFHRNSTAGHKQMLDGVVIGTIIPDWMLGFWKKENPRLSGKIKLMPIPAFEPGGRRTSLLGGSMIGINKRSAHIEESWEIAKTLYMSEAVAEHTFRETNMISPVKAHWALPFYQEPDPFVCGQPSGALFIEQAPHVPLCPSSPYKQAAYRLLTNITISLRTYAEQNGVYEAEVLAPVALRLLHDAQVQLNKRISRNVFHEETASQPIAPKTAD